MEELLKVLRVYPHIPVLLTTGVVLFLVGWYFAFNKIRSGSLQKRLLAPSLTMILVSLLLVGLGIYFYLIREGTNTLVTAQRFGAEYSNELEILEEKRYLGWQEAGLFIVDLRSREEYEKEHIKGAANYTLAGAAKELYPLIEADLAIYTSKAKISEALKLQREIEANYQRKIQKYAGKKRGKVFVIQEGFEGLKQQGLTLETGGLE